MVHPSPSVLEHLPQSYSLILPSGMGKLFLRFPEGPMLGSGTHVSWALRC